MKGKRKKMKFNVKYIIVHSTQTHPREIPPVATAHYTIQRNGRVVKNKNLSATDGCVDVAYNGGKDKDGITADTRTERQTESLFNQLIALIEQHPQAVIKAAQDFFEESHAIGFNLNEWLANYIPTCLTKAA